jgi:hypothetical protein
MIVLREIRKQKKAASLVKSQKYGVLMSGQTESTINKTNRIDLRKLGANNRFFWLRRPGPEHNHI